MALAVAVAGDFGLLAQIAVAGAAILFAASWFWGIAAFTVLAGGAALMFALPAYVIGCLYIAATLLKIDVLVMPLRFISWLVAAPYWPCVLAWTHTFDRLTGTVAAVLMISPFVLPGVTFAGYMQGPKLWAKSEKAMAEGRRRAKAKSRVARKKRTPRAQKPEI